MNLAAVFTMTELAAALLLGEIAVSSVIRTVAARFNCTVKAPDHALALFAGSGCLALLAVAGTRTPVTAAGSVLLLAMAALPLANLIRLGAKQGKADVARERVSAALRLMLQDARYLPVRDLRAVLGLLRGGGQATDGRPAGDGDAGYRPAQGRARAVPSILNDVALGPVPPPAAVSDNLMTQGVAVPGYWAAAAEAVATFEADDVDDWRTWWLEQAAGILTVAAAFQEHAEAMGVAWRLDPDVIAAIDEFSDMFADVAPGSVMVVRRHDETYQAPIEHVDAGGSLPRDGWLNPGDAAPQAGAA